MMTTVRNTSQEWPTSHKKGWLGGKATKVDFLYELQPPHLAAIQALCSRIKASGQETQNISRSEFSHPDLDSFLAQMSADLKHGKGLVILRGISPADYPEDDLRLIYWGIGNHMGEPVSQSILGDRLGEIRMRGQDAVRAYQSNRELALHTDTIDILSLMSIRKAKSGGASIFASSLAVWDAMEAERPDLVPVLKHGFRTWRFHNQADGDAEETPYFVPVFSEQNGLRSCFYIREIFETGHRNLGLDLSASQLEALELFDAIANRGSAGFDADLQPGEIVFVNNFEVMHSRTAFEDWDDPSAARLLLRLWLQGSPWQRPLHHHARIFHNKSGRQGIDPDPKRGAATDYVRKNPGEAA